MSLYCIFLLMHTYLPYGRQKMTQSDSPQKYSLIARVRWAGSQSGLQKLVHRRLSIYLGLVPYSRISRNCCSPVQIQSSEQHNPPQLTEGTIHSVQREFEMQYTVWVHLKVRAESSDSNSDGNSNNSSSESEDESENITQSESNDNDKDTHPSTYRVFESLGILMLQIWDMSEDRVRKVS